MGRLRRDDEKGIDETPGITVIGNMDDDQLMVGPSTTAPWTTYVLADAQALENVAAVCSLFRTTPVGDGGISCGSTAKSRPALAAN